MITSVSVYNPSQFRANPKKKNKRHVNPITVCAVAVPRVLGVESPVLPRTCLDIAMHGMAGSQSSRVVDLFCWAEKY